MNPTNWITPKDCNRSCTVHSLEELLGLLALIKRNIIGGKLLDIGCGFGGIARTLKDFLEHEEAYGIDIDQEALAEARSKGIITARCDISREKLPYPDAVFDIVTIFGVLDYLPHFDDILLEIHRVLRPGGYVCVSLPNLASWHNRLALLLGYQPRDIEVSRYYLCGVHPLYRRRGEKPVGHIHTITTRGFLELMEHYQFSLVRILGVNPQNHTKIPILLKVIDSIVGKSPYLARRFIYLGRRK